MLGRRFVSGDRMGKKKRYAKIKARGQTNKSEQMEFRRSHSASHFSVGTQLGKEHDTTFKFGLLQAACCSRRRQPLSAEGKNLNGSPLLDAQLTVGL